jgi:tetratricopeptide (TPR) repeat protein
MIGKKENKAHSTGNNSPAIVGNNATINYAGIPIEQFTALAQELGLTKTALQNFFKILEQENISPTDYDHTLRQIAERYHNLLDELRGFQADDPDVKALITQAEKHLEQGEFDQAETLINQASDKDQQAALQMLENANKRLLSAAEAKAKNAELSLTQLNYLKAANYYQQAFKLTPSEFAEKEAYYANQAGSAFHDAGKYPQAEPLYQRSLKILEAVLGAQHPDVAASLNNLAVLYKTQGFYEKAEPLYQRSLKILEAVLGAQHPDVAQSLNNLAALYRTQGLYEKAEPLYQRSLKIREAVLGAQHPDVAISLNNLAALYNSQGVYEKAEPLYQRALNILEKSLGKNHPNTKTVQENYNILLEKMKE